MTITPRDYQNDIIHKVERSWYEYGNRSVCAVLPTGGGKTPTFTVLTGKETGFAVEIAHRAELVSQIAMAAGMHQMPHRIIAPPKIVSAIITQQVKKFGRHYVDDQAQKVIAGVDTLNSWAARGKLGNWPGATSLCTLDEGHHVLAANKWGKAFALFQRARGLGVTATAMRPDGKSLHAEQGGIYNDLVQGVDMRWLMDHGHLCDYRVIDPGESIDVSGVDVTASGDFSGKQLSAAGEKSTIVGDVVTTYLQHKPGKRAICFAIDVKEAHDIAKAFRERGVRAEALDGKTDETVRNDAVQKFRDGHLDVLVNVDLFGEGFDVPAVEVVIMARPTMSFVLFAQMIGRALRPMDGKEFGWIIDHAGNVRRMAKLFGLPDTPRRWKLWLDNPGRRQKERDPELIPQRLCEECGSHFDATTRTCDTCGHYHEPEDRSKPASVDGILHEMSPELLHELRSLKADADAALHNFSPAIPLGANSFVATGIRNRHAEFQAAQHELRNVMAYWAGPYHAAGETDEKIQARFYYRFNIDVMSAQALKATKARELTAEIRLDLDNMTA